MQRRDVYTFIIIVRTFLAHFTSLSKNPLYLFLLLAGLLLAACSVERNNPLSKSYHNTTARYNGYFLAKEKMRAIEEGLQQQMQYDYRQVLPIYPAFDSTTAKALAADLEEVVKKASFPIQYHQSSKWVDNSYTLIGKANYYQLNFIDASRTFKYVNTTSSSADDRHEALVWLMRTFLQLKELDNAHQVSEYLRKERLNKDNARELYLARAQYHRMLGDTAQEMENLALSLPNFTDRDAQSRVRFTLAQLYQLSGQHKKAHSQYSKVLRRNPPYELDFFSRLNLGQVTELNDRQGKERILHHFKKLLKDEKNKEYRDKIYYEMAMFELRQQHYDKALELLQQSLRNPGTLANQKAYSYVAAGEIYFDKLHKYNLAAAYYDSAAQVYPQQAPEYAAVAERRDILADFARQHYTIQRQDSLQRLARMGEGERMAYLQQLVQQEEEKRRLQQAKQQAQQEDTQRNRTAARNPAHGTFTTPGSDGIWYFDNPAAMTRARSEFVRRWGDRPLQDFWRVRSRGEREQEAQIARSPAAGVAEQQLSPEARAQAQMQAYLKDIPLTTADLMRSEKEVEEAYFKLANIYNHKLKEPAEAIKTYLQLLQRFPHTEHAAEVYYSLYLLHGKAGDTQQQQLYAGRIKQQFPNTTYAQLVEDADFTSKNAAANLKAHALYDTAYTFYQEQDYAQAMRLLNQLASQYPFNDIQDKVSFLEALISGHTQNPGVLHRRLQRFKTDFPKSSLLPQVDKLLATYQELEQKNQLRQQASVVSGTKAKAAQTQTPEEKVDAALATATASLAKDVPRMPASKPAAATSLPKQPVADTAVRQPAAEPAAQQPRSEKQPETVLATTDTPDSVAAPAPAEAPAYQAAADTAFYFVLVYPTSATAFTDVLAKYEKYNSTYFKQQQLQTASLPFSEGRQMLVIRAFKDPKLALSYNIKQKAPQAPVGRIRGIDFTTFVISSANYQKFLQQKDLEAYLTFFKNNY